MLAGLASRRRVGIANSETWNLRRYWEDLIRDDDELRRHIDYIHFNPVKHGHVERGAQTSGSVL